MKQSPLFNISQPFAITDDIVPSVFNMLGQSTSGLLHILYFTSTSSTKDVLRVNSKSPIKYSSECCQYYVLSGRSIVGSLFETRITKTQAYPYKVIVGSAPSIDNVFKCITPPNDKGGVFAYKDSSSNILLVTVDVSASPFVIMDP